MSSTTLFDGYALARAAITALLAGDDRSFESLMNDADPSVVTSCCYTLAGMSAAYVLKAADAADVDPLCYWQQSIQRAMSQVGWDNV